MERAITGILAIMVALAAFPALAGAQTASNSLTETFLNQDPDPAQPGKYVELRWKVEKAGNGQISNVEYFLDVDYPFFFDGSDAPERNLGNIGGVTGEDDFFTLYWKVRVDEDALEDAYKVNLRKRDSFSESFVSKEYDIRVGNKERAEFVIGQISTSPTRLTSDLDEAQLDVDIANIGDSDAENVVVELELPDGFSPSYSFSERDALGTISQGSSKTATFFIDIAKDVAGGVHDATLRITYKDSSDDGIEVRTATLGMPLPLKDRPLFEVERVEATPETVLPGSAVQLRLFIKNAGGEKADSVSVRAFSESSQPFSFDQKSDFIGKLEPGDTGEAIIELTVDADAAEKNYLLDIEIRGVDDSEVIVQERTIDLLVGQSQGDGAGMATGIATASLAAFVVVAIVLVAGAFLYGRKSAGGKMSRASSS